MASYAVRSAFFLNVMRLLQNPRAGIPTLIAARGSRTIHPPAQSSVSFSRASRHARWRIPTTPGGGCQRKGCRLQLYICTLTREGSDSAPQQAHPRTKG